MAEIAHTIKINLPAKLQDKGYRQKFFLAESSAQLAEQIAALRKRRNLNQTQLAEMVDTKQPAISRVEQADYQNWNFGTVQKIVGALDGRIRVIIEASEDVLPEYEEHVESEEASEPAEPAEPTVNAGGLLTNFFALANIARPAWEAYQLGWMGTTPQSHLGSVGSVDPFTQMANQIAQKDAEIAELKSEILTLKARTLLSASDYQVGGRFNMTFGSQGWHEPSVQQP